MTLFCGIKRLGKCLSDFSIKVRRMLCHIYDEACIACTSFFPCFATCGGKVLKGEGFEREASERDDRAYADLQV